VRTLAGNPVSAAHGPARSRRCRARAHVVHNLINYLVWVVYLGVGLAVAESDGYLGHDESVRSVLVEAGAVLAWPWLVIR
jgi:hypothetical protein